MWLISYQENWGTRFQRRFHNFYTTRKPTKSEAVAILNKNKVPATLRWFDKPCSGLITISQIQFEF